NGETALHFAAQCGDLEMVKWLIEQGLDVNAKDAHGRTSLLYAAIKGDLELVKWLVEHGADVNAKTNIGLSILFYVEVDGVESKKIIQYLKEHDAVESEL
ncbi:MAG: ankyrin repeat domain-containing protein, partial [Ruminococcus sp.]|nr:ankyrin repeat domain-containing protein [Ruminococcus sp.]